MWFIGKEMQNFALLFFQMIHFHMQVHYFNRKLGNLVEGTMAKQNMEAHS